MIPVRLKGHSTTEHPSFYIIFYRGYYFKSVTKFSADSVNALSFYEIFCEHQNVP